MRRPPPRPPPVPSPALFRALEGRRRTVERQREGLRASLSRTRERLDRYTLELQRHGLDSVDREVRWLAELIDRELTDSERRSEEHTSELQSRQYSVCRLLLE